MASREVHALLLLGKVSGYRKFRWLIDSHLLNRFGIELEREEVERKLEGKSRCFVRGEEEYVGPVVVLRSVSEHGEVEAGEVVVLTSESILEDESEIGEVEERVERPLEESGYNVELKGLRSVVLPSECEVVEQSLKLLRRVSEVDSDGYVLFDLTHGLRVMSFSATIEFLAAVRLFLAELTVNRVIAGERPSVKEAMDRIVLTYSLAGEWVRGVMRLKRGEGAVLDVTDRLLQLRCLDLMAEFLKDPSPTAVEELRELTGGGGGVDVLGKLALIDRTSVPGLMREFLERHPDPPRIPGVPDSVVETVWNVFKSIFLRGREKK